MGKLLGRGILLIVLFAVLAIVLPSEAQAQQINVTSFGFEDSKYLPLYELSSYADSVYKSYSDLRYNITKDKSSKSSLLLNFINYINQPDKFNDQLMFIVDPILRGTVIMGVVTVYGLALWIWLNHASHAYMWVPYRNHLFS